MSRHPYTGEDEDELTFEKGVVIHVIPYDNPDDEVQPNTCMYMYLNTCMYMYLNTCMYMYLRTCMYMYLRTCMYMYFFCTSSVNLSMVARLSTFKVWRAVYVNVHVCTVKED